jgi:uncharacterized protein (DUF305 family)
MKHAVFFLCFLFSFRMGYTQEMRMGNMRAPNRNVFLKMMDTMMLQMAIVSDSAAVESNFMRQMIPHHQGAVAMADYEIRSGKDFATIQLAKSIRAEQENEIQLMQIWLKQPPGVKHPCALPEGYRISMKKSMDQMMSDMPADARLSDIDQAFSRVMMPHHQAAVDMARAVLRYSTDQQTNLFAQHIISSQEVEIEQMMLAIKQ